VLLSPDAALQPIRLPRADELTRREQQALRRRLRDALAGWLDDAEGRVGLHMTLRADGSEQVPALPEALTYRLQQAPVLISVQPELAAALVCVSLGDSAPREVDAHLTPVDLAVLEVTILPALEALAAALSLPAGGPLQRLGLGAREAAAQLDGPAVGALLHSPHLAGGGLVLVAQEAVRQALAQPGPSLADDPRPLLQARVTAEARVSGARVPLVEMLAAEAGDVVLLDGPISREIRLFVGDTEVARGRPGARSGRMAVRITAAGTIPPGGRRHGE
jgi:flagellar motor switch/type III secretory pathway protein FliN